MKRYASLALIAVLVLGMVIILGACSSGGSSSSTPASSGGNTTIQNNTQGSQAASSASHGINMALGMTEAFGNLGSIGFAEEGITAPSPGAFGNYEQSPAISRLVGVTSKFAMAHLAATAASGVTSPHLLSLGSGTCTDGGTYTLGQSTDGGLAALFFSGCREDDVQVDGEYDIQIFAPVTSGYSMSVTLGSALTPTAFTLQDYGPGYTTLISKTTMTGFPMSLTLTLAGSTVAAANTYVNAGSMSINDYASAQTYSVSLTRLSDSFAISTSGTTSLTMNGTFAESWTTSTGSDSVTATFTNFQLAITPGSASEALSVSGTLSIAFTPAFCQNGTFTFLTNTPIVYDSLGTTTAGKLTVNGATTITYNSDGTVTVATGNQSQTYPSLYNLAQVCPTATFGEPATYTVTYNGNGSTSGSVPIDSNMYQEGQTVTVLSNTGDLVNTGYSFAGWNTAADGSGTTYTPGQTFAMGTANVALYAVWTTSPTYTVTYNGGAATTGSVPVDSNNYLQGATVTVLSNTGGLVKTGYSFAGWQLALNGISTTYQPGQTFSMPASDVVLVAQWTSSTVLGYVYVANNAANLGSISQYTIGLDGALTSMTTPTVAAGSCTYSITADPSGKYVYSTDVCDNYKVYQYTIGAGGLLTPMTPGSFAAGAFPTSVIVDPSGQHVYVANEGGKSISQYAIGLDGTLASLTTPTVAAVSAPAALATDPTGSYLYVANDAANGTISLYDIGAGGALSLSATGAPIVAGAFSEAIAVSGQYVYEPSFTAYSGAIYQYAIGGGGVLSFLTPSTYNTGAAAEDIIAVSGKYVYVADSGENEITQYAIVSGGTLSALSPFTVAAGTDPTGVAADPTGQYVYVTNYGDGTVSQYAIGLDGTLTSMTTPTVPAGYGPRSIVTVGIH